MQIFRRNAIYQIADCANQILHIGIRFALRFAQCLNAPVDQFRVLGKALDRLPNALVLGEMLLPAVVAVSVSHCC